MGVLTGSGRSSPHSSRQPSRRGSALAAAVAAGGGALLPQFVRPLDAEGEGDLQSILVGAGLQHMVAKFRAGEG